MLGFAFIRDLPIKAKFSKKILSTRFCMNPLTVLRNKNGRTEPLQFYVYI